MICASPNPGGFPSKTNVHLTKTFSHCEGDFVCVFVCVYVCVCEWGRERAPKHDFVFYLFNGMVAILMQQPLKNSNFQRSVVFRRGTASETSSPTAS